MGAQGTKADVYVRGTQRFCGEEGEPSVVAQRAEGMLREVRGKTHILYDEPGEDGVRAHVILGEDCIEVKRSGGLSSTMLFSAGRETEAVYRTPYGTAVFTVSASSVRVLREGNTITAEAVYTLRQGDNVLADCVTEMRFASLRQEPS